MTPILFGVVSIQIDVGGMHTYPRPNPEFFNLNGSYATACPPSMKVPGRDVCVVPCLPADACIGDNFCSDAYMSKEPFFRCGSCAPGYYNNDGPCIKCPDSPAAIIIGFVLMISVGAAAAYWLDKRNVNLAFVSIGIDYFQVGFLLWLDGFECCFQFSIRVKSCLLLSHPYFRFLPFLQTRASRGLQLLSRFL